MIIAIIIVIIIVVNWSLYQYNKNKLFGNSQAVNAQVAANAIANKATIANRIAAEKAVADQAASEQAAKTQLDALAKAAALQMAKQFDNKFVSASGHIWYIENGYKRYIDYSIWQSLRLDIRDIITVSSEVIARIPDGAAAAALVLGGNNGTQNCANYLSGWVIGREDRRFKGVRATHPDVRSDGTCAGMLTDDPRFYYPESIGGNNGAASCNLYCSRYWGYNALANLWPGVTGAKVAPGAQNVQVNGNCTCVPDPGANIMLWNTNPF